MGGTGFNSLDEIISAMIEDAGFDPELYTLINRGVEVHVDFDEKPFADYLIKISNEPQWTDQVAAAYNTWNKRHRVTFILW
jgi:hypothetical protein